MIIKNLQKNTGPAPYEAKGFRSGFVILFAVTLAAILLSIALGVSNIALKEIKFGTSAKDTNEAFFAADTGAEFVLFRDRSDTDPVIYPVPNTGSSDEWTEDIYNLGSSGESCVKVTITKDYSTPNSDPILKTTIVSKGHNNNPAGDCTSNSGTVERQLEVRY